MKWLIAFTLLLVPAHLAAAPAEHETTRDYAKLLEDVEFLRNLAMLLQAQGYKDVQIIPQMFVATAKDRDG
jgi:hypothetical protein